MRSATVKRYIQRLVRRFGELKPLYITYCATLSDETRAAVKAVYEELFDWENMRDYLIFSDVINNRDGFGKNWQWTTYDGVKWYVNAYDLDISFGTNFVAQISPPLTGHVDVSASLTLPSGYMFGLYRPELQARYKELRDAGIISVSNILGKLEDWTARVGSDNYELEYQRWPNSTCIVNYIDSIYRVKKWLETEIANMDKVYHYNAFTWGDMQKIHDADIESVRRETAGLANLRHIYDEGLQEQINELAELRLTQILKDYQDTKDTQAESDRERLRQQREADHLQAQADEVAEAVIQAMLNDTRERERLDARITTIEEALAESEILTSDSASVMTNTEVNNMVDNVFNGSDSTHPEPQDEDEAEIYDMLDDVFSGNDTDTYEDDVTDDIDNIFNP